MAAAADSWESSVRRRRVDGRKTQSKCADSSEQDAANSAEDPQEETAPQSLRTGTHWLTRIVLLRSVAFIYCKHAVALLVKHVVLFIASVLVNLVS